MNWLKRKVIRLMNYEYWPYGVFYFPMYFYGFYLAAKARSFTYFTTTNPGMLYGGIMGESKYKVLQLIPKNYLPVSIFIRQNTSITEILEIFEKNELQFPVIAKPDKGERGKNVEKIDCESALKLYLENSESDIIIQEFVPYTFEVGVLYYRYPNEEKGAISSVVMKDFLVVQGDGKSTLKSLILGKTRAFGRKEYLFNKFQMDLDKIIPKGEIIYLEPIGNHCRGTAFLNGNDLINEELVESIDAIASKIPGFYYGRFDIRAKSKSDLLSGKNLKILELNGVSSEPAHIYDPNYRLINAYRDLAQHMKIIYRISKINYKNGVPRTPLSVFLKDLFSYFKQN